MASSELAAKLARRNKMNEDGDPDKYKEHVSGASSELAAKLERRARAAEGDVGRPTDNIGNRRASQNNGPFNPFNEFPEFSRKEIKEYLDTFKTYDEDKNSKLSITELKKLMERLGHPQTHTQLWQMIREVDEDGDGELNQKEFLTIFRKVRGGELRSSEGLTSLTSLYDAIQSVEVHEVGVGGAKAFFEAKVGAISTSMKAEAEVKEEQLERRRAVEEEKKKKSDFKAKIKAFNQGGAAPAPDKGA